MKKRGYNTVEHVNPLIRAHACTIYYKQNVGRYDNITIFKKMITSMFTNMSTLDNILVIYKPKPKESNLIHILF